MIGNISVVIIAHNAQNTLKQCLDSLTIFSEVVVYENNSTDNTEYIAKQYSNVKFVSGEFVGFGKTKNIAASYSSNDWILSLDSDEVLTQTFIDSLKSIELLPNTVYKIKRQNYYKNIYIKHCWADDYIVRLYNKNSTQYNDNDVHEEILIDGFNTVVLQGNVKHYSYQSIEQFVNKANNYSTLFAKNHVGTKSSSPLKAFLNGGYSFIKTYIFKQGFRDGYVGLIIAFSHMVTNFYKYIKLYELNKELK